ncbi:MAG: ABC transporter permease [Thermoplasmata archaeon]|nr:ABC transporter permease [Thermoplasmata archaeon]
MTLDINWKGMLTVVKKEFIDSVRNKWIIAVTIIFVSLALLVSYFGSAMQLGETGFQGFLVTIVLIMAISVLLVTMIALMLGYGAIATERERGSLDLLLTMPITRTEAVVSKFIGLATVLFVSIFVGFGLAGIVIAAVAGAADFPKYLLFLGATFMVGLAFLSVAFLLSTVTKRRSTAMGGAVLLWFFFILIYDIVLIGVFVATGGDLFTPGSSLPDWYYAAELFSPSSAYGMATSLMLGGNASEILPGFVNGFSTVGSLLAWILIPLVIAIWVLNRRDI